MSELSKKEARLQDESDQRILGALVRLGVVEAEEAPADEAPAAAPAPIAPAPPPAPPKPATTRLRVKQKARK